MKTLIGVMMLGGGLAAAQATTWDVTLELNGLQRGNKAPSGGPSTQGGTVGVGIRYDDISNTLTVNTPYGISRWNPLAGDSQGVPFHSGAAGHESQVLRNHLAALQFPFHARLGVFAGNLQSPGFPGGEIRGSLTMVPEPETVALVVLGFGALVWMIRRDRT